MADQLPEKVLEDMRLLIGSLPAMESGDPFEDNLGIALTSYFEHRIDCPEQEQDETGWKPWAVERTNDLLNSVARLAIAESSKELREKLERAQAYIREAEMYNIPSGFKTMDFSERHAIAIKEAKEQKHV